MEFLGLRLLLFAIFCIAITTGRSIDCDQNSFMNSKSIACRGGYGGAYMPPGTGGGGGGNDGTSTNGGGNEAGGAAGAGAAAMSTMTDMASAMMNTAQQAMGRVMDTMSNMNPLG